MPGMRLVVRLLAAGVGTLFLLVMLGPSAPEGWVLHDWAVAARQALNAWWGFPLGLPAAPRP
jgi:hypothetical protein